MLKVNLRAGGPDMVEVQGDLKGILTDLSITIKTIHAQMRSTAPAAAEVFKRALQMGMAQEDGPVWGGGELRFTGIGFVTPGPRKEPGQ